MNKSKFLKYFIFLLIFSLPMTTLSASSVEIQPFVVGGSNVTDWSEYPFQVGLVNKSSANFADGAYGEQFCGGVVVSDTWILTAAHCVTSVNQATGTFTLKDAANIGVIGGKLKLSDYREVDVVAVSEISIHPNAALFDQGAGVSGDRYLLSINDIALLRVVAKPSGTTAIAEIGNTAGDVDGVASLISGWGKSNDDPATFPDTLQFGSVSVVSNTNCLTIYGSIFRADTQICAQGGSTGSRIDVCSGDSGGPLVIGTKTSLTGLTSYGQVPCAAEAPGVFTRVSAFLGWIHPNIDTLNVAAQSSLALSTSSVVANNSSTSTVTVQLKNASGTNLTSGGATVAIQSSLGTVSSVTDNLNGTYSATVRSSSAGSASITASVNGTALTNTATLSFTSLPSPPSSGGGGGAPAPAPVVVAAPVVAALAEGVRVSGSKWNVVTDSDGVTRARVAVGTQFRGKRAVFFKRLKSGRLVRVGTGRIGRAGRANLETSKRFKEGQKIRIQIDGRFRATVTIRN